MTTRNDCPACGGRLVSEPIGASLRCTRCTWRLITLAEWNKLPPLEQGFALYMQSSWPTSELAKAKNPYAAGSPKHTAFREGEQRATRSAQDGEE
jgi:hypothetical protein